MKFDRNSMKRTILGLVISIISIALSSCNKSDGYEDLRLGEPLTLSSKEVSILPNGGETTVTILKKRRAWIEFAQYWSNANIIEDSQYISPKPNSGIIEHEWFSAWVDVEDDYEVIHIKLTPNDTGLRRRVNIGLQSVNIFSSFFVFQDPL